LAKGQFLVVKSHLDNCEDCRLELHRLQYALGSPVELVPDSGMLAQMRSAIEEWEKAARNGEPVKRRVATEILPFLGPKATEYVMQPVAESGENLLSSIEPVLALFLGGRAAARLVNHVVDSALLRA
jgi:hypothetical protein